MKTISSSTYLAFVAVVLASMALLPQVQAVSPTPDGCYPNYTTAEGCNALHLLTSGAANTALGWSSLFSDSSGSFNTGVGAGALALNNADSNTAVGAVALFSNTTGIQNTAIGFDALANNTADNNTAIGEEALIANTGGSNNTAVGIAALSSNTTGMENIALGDSAGGFLTTGSNNIEIGNIGAPGDSNTIRIGNISVQSATFIAGISGQVTSGGVAVFVDGTGKLGTNASSARFKDQIKPMNNVSEAILALKPVTFRYKQEFDPQGFPQFGLIAEEVDKVNPDLVSRDKDGKPFTVRYDAVNAMLLNEFLKEHRRVQELEGTVAQQKKDAEATAARQQKQIEALTEGLQKVSARLELNKPAPQTVKNTD